MGAAKDRKANTSLTKLNLKSNNVGDAGASALADALQAKILMCKKCVFRARGRCHRKCWFTESSAEWRSSTSGESLFMSVSRELRAGCSQVDVAQCQNQTGLTAGRWTQYNMLLPERTFVPLLQV